jgi:lipoprotein-anchoring transpeptidase ErfK/SrfK
MRKPFNHLPVPVLALIFLSGCAFEPYPPLPYEVEPQAVTEPGGEVVVETPRPRKGAKGGQLTIRLKSQSFEYREGGQLVRAGEISSGSPQHPTPKGSFQVLSKDADKRSGSYTNYFEQPTPMPYALQFYGPYYVHEGWIAGRPESHGCVRLHYEDAKVVFERIRVGDKVAVVD